MNELISFDVVGHHHNIVVAHLHSLIRQTVSFGAATLTESDKILRINMFFVCIQASLTASKQDC